MVVFDADTLICLFHAKTPEDDKARINHLLGNLQKAKIKVIIPAPALTEVLVKAGKAREEILIQLSTSNAFRVEPFDKRSAIECAIAMEKALAAGDKRDGNKAAWHKAKFDYQIVAIAKTANVTTVYSNDEGLKKFALKAGMTVVQVKDIPLPPEAAQKKLPLNCPQ